ncbi:MAG TPA: hypothetical protein VGM28_08115, partial [Candidatus Limnocylindrales bacterium]
MTTDRETTRIVRSWMAEGVDRLPERVLDAVLDQVPATQQRRSLRPAWRPFRMPKIIAAVAVAAAVLLVAVVGLRLLPNGNGVAGPAPSPSPTPSASPTPVAITSDMLGTPLDPGAYRVADPFGHAFSISMPAGWSVQSLAAGQVKLGGAGRDLEFYVVHDVPADPCHPGPSDPSATPPPAGQLVTSLSSLTGFQSGPITSVAVGNRRASRFVISNAIDTSTAGCDGDKLLPLFTPVGGEPASTNGGTVQQ